MKKISFIGYCLLVIVLAACTSADKVTKNTLNQEEVMAKMSLEDKAHFVIGVGMAGFSGDDAVIGATKSLVPGAAGTTYPLDSLGIHRGVIQALERQTARHGSVADDGNYICFGIGICFRVGDVNT